MHLLQKQIEFCDYGFKTLEFGLFNQEFYPDRRQFYA